MYYRNGLKNYVIYNNFKFKKLGSIPEYVASFLPASEPNI